MWGRIISTHALTEGDGIVSGLASTGAFQLTPSWRATKTDCSCNSSGHISTHALTEGDDQLFCNAEFSLISTHALTEGDTGAYANSDMRTSFQLTPSRRATRFESSIFRFPVISTHALTEGDTAPQQLQPNHSHFNSRPHGGRRSGYVSLTIPLYFNSRPHGGRQSLSQEIDVTKAFQLTPSRRATIWNADSFFLRKISTHALTEGDRIPADISILPVQISTHALTEGDGFCDTYPHFYNYHFNSRPHGGRPAEFWCFR